tara:strand:- start:1807 stop:2031 length:225 start_codon:yes stop_codon:yes gene_type:complete
MGKLTDNGWLKEDDPIFNEGLTGFTARKQSEPWVLASIRKDEPKEEFKEQIKDTMREAGILKDKNERKSNGETD